MSAEPLPTLARGEIARTTRSNQDAFRIVPSGSAQSKKEIRSVNKLSRAPVFAKYAHRATMQTVKQRVPEAAARGSTSGSTSKIPTYAKLPLRSVHRAAMRVAPPLGRFFWAFPCTGKLIGARERAFAIHEISFDAIENVVVKATATAAAFFGPSPNGDARNCAIIVLARFSKCWSASRE